MVEWKQHELEIISRYKGMHFEQVLSSIPEQERQYKCYNCYLIVKHEDLIDGKCPVCGSFGMLNTGDLKLLCPLEHNGCSHPIVEKLEYCPICKQAICPVCGDHNVLQISRVTGYMADVSNFNLGKRAELSDRQRYNIMA